MAGYGTIVMIWLLGHMGFSWCATSTWSVGRIMGQLDTSGSFNFWRDLSPPKEFPYPMDDTDGIALEIQDFVLIHFDRSYVDLLHLSQGIDTKVESQNRFGGLQGRGQYLRNFIRDINSTLSTFLFIVGESGTIFRGLELEQRLERGKAVFGIDFPRLIAGDGIGDDCVQSGCRLQLTFAVKGEVVTRGNQSWEETHFSFHLKVGANAGVEFVNKVFHDFDTDSSTLGDLVLSMASQSPSETLVTITVPFTSESLLYTVFLTPGTPLMEFPTTHSPGATPKAGIHHLPFSDPDSAEYDQEAYEKYEGDDSEIKLNPHDPESVLHSETSTPTNDGRKTSAHFLHTLTLICTIRFLLQ